MELDFLAKDAREMPYKVAKTPKMINGLNTL